jgi:ABC-type phosphate transport system substrate-binding protein/Fe-S cluster biogenesis protein NfuA
MDRLSVPQRFFAFRRRSLALTALIATLALSATLAQSAVAKGGGQIGEGFGTPGTGNGQFFNPAMFGADPVDGTLYTGDLIGATSESQETNYRIQQLSSSGTFKASAEIKRFPVANTLVGLQGIAVDHELGRVYVVEGCRVKATGGSLACLTFGGKIGARKILVYSTTPEGTKLVPDKTLPSIALPEGEKEIYEPQAIAVDPSSHDILILASENEKHRIVQRISSAGVLGARYTDKADQLKPASGAANSLAVSPGGVAYTMTGGSTPPATFTKVWQLPASLASLEETPGVSAAATKEEWILGLETKVEGFYGGPQLAISADGSTLYWKEWRKRSEEAEAGELNIRAYSLSKGETVGLWGGGTTKCKITTSSAALAATSGGNLAVFDLGAPTKKSTDIPKYGLKVLTFGPSGSGCNEPVAKFTINGKKEGEEPTGIKPGDTVAFDATSSELAGGARKELIWKFGDGSEKVVTAAKEGEEASPKVEHVYAAAGKYTVRLEIKLQVPLYGNPDPRERTFTVGTVVSKFKLKVSKTGAGTVTSSPAGINCGGDCEEEYESGKEVELTQSADPGSKFVKWGGACSGSGACKVTMSAEKEVTAEFVPIPKFLLKVKKAGTGSGTVTSNPVGINCGGDCEEEYEEGKEVELTPSADAGSKFVEWGGACSGTGACKVTMTAAKEVTATFDKEVEKGKFTLQVTKSGIGTGPIASTPAGIDCHAICQASFTEGTVVTLAAEPDAGTKAAVWTGCDEVTGEGKCKVTMSSNREVNAFLNGISCAGANITGAGSSLQSIAHNGVWKPAFEEEVCDEGSFPTVSYEPTGSGAGMAEWNYDGKKGSINTGLSFIGTDAAPTAAQIANIKSKAGGAQLAVVPVAQTSIAILANPPAGCEVETITNSNLAGVMEGRIREWSKLETAAGSCNSPITRVVRKDGSGTTYQLKNYLYRLYGKGLSCTTGGTEGKASWAELEPIGEGGKPNTTWPESCEAKALSTVVRPAGNGGAEEVKAVNATSGSIGYSALPDAVAGKAGSTTILSLQNNGQKKAVEATFADPAAGAVANCAAMSYQVPAPLGARRDVDWSAVFGAKPAIGGEAYPLCALTYALAFHGYGAAGFGEGQYLTVRDYLYGYVVQAAGQAAINSNDYSALPASAEERFDVLGAARRAAEGISQ